MGADMISSCPFTWPRILLLLPTVTAAACSSLSPQPNVDENAFPANYRDAVLAAVTTSQSFDPTNIRDGSISEPVLKKPPAGDTMRYVACVRFDARNEKREYTGLTEYVVYFYAGDINQFVRANAGQCASATYKPFPEVEKICKGQECK